MLTSYFSLFMWSFLSATILPLGVEPYFISVVSQTSQITWPVVVASAGNSLGGLTLLLMGAAGNPWLIRIVQKENQKKLEKVTHYTRKYGNPVLLLSWIPVFGDLLVMLVGLSKPNLKMAGMYLIAGKTARFIALALLTSEIHFPG